MRASGASITYPPPNTCRRIANVSRPQVAKRQGIRKSGALALQVLRQPNAAELPTRRGWEKVAICGPDVAGRRGARSAAQHHLSHHELAVIFRRHALQWPEPGIGIIGGA